MKTALRRPTSLMIVLGGAILLILALLRSGEERGPGSGGLERVAETSRSARMSPALTSPSPEAWKGEDTGKSPDPESVRRTDRQGRSATGSILTGRVLQGREPLSLMEVVVGLVSEGDGLTIGEETLTTDAAGRIAWRRERALEDGWIFTLRLAHAPHGLERASARPRSLPPAEPSGRVDLGDIPLHLPPPTVTGVVVGPDRGPIAGAELRIHTFGRTPEQGSVRYDDAGPFESGTDGTFRSYASLPPDQTYRVAARDTETNVWAWTAFEPGDTGVVIQIPREVRVRGSVLLGFDPPYPPLVVSLFEGDPEAEEADTSIDMFQLLSRFEGDPGTLNLAGEGALAVRRSWSAQTDEQGGFQFVAIPEGRYHLEVREKTGFRSRLWTGEAFLLTPAVSGEAVQLPTADLRGLVRRVSVRCETQDGRPLEGVEIHGKAAFGGPGSGGRTDANGLFTVLLPAEEGAMASCTLAGLQPVDVALTQDPTVVILDSELAVPVEAPLAIEVPEPFHLGVLLIPAGQESSSGFEGTIDEYGIGVVRLPHEGRYSVRLQLRYEEGPRRYSVDLLGPSGQPGVDPVVDVARTTQGSVPSIRAETADAELQRALAELTRLRDR